MLTSKRGGGRDKIKIQCMYVYVYVAFLCLRVTSTQPQGGETKYKHSVVVCLYVCVAFLFLLVTSTQPAGGGLTNTSSNVHLSSTSNHLTHHYTFLRTDSKSAHIRISFSSKLSTAKSLPCQSGCSIFSFNPYAPLTTATHHLHFHYTLLIDGF
jgi:hypothetical protein